VVLVLVGVEVVVAHRVASHLLCKLRMSFAMDESRDDGSGS